MCMNNKENIISILNSKVITSNVISELISWLELGPTIGVRRTFSRDSMLKAYLLLWLKKIKSYRALVKYLRNRPEEAITLGFDKSSDNSVRIPTHQDLSYFVRSLSKEELELTDFVIKTIEDTTEHLCVNKKYLDNGKRLSIKV